MEGKGMKRELGESKSIYYFQACGEVNTEKTLSLAIKRAHELGIKKMVVASETGLSALEAVEMLRNSGIDLIVVTSAAGKTIDSKVIGALKIGIMDKRVWNQLEKSGAKIVRGTDPFHNIGAALECRGVPTLATLIRTCLSIISSGTSVCVAATMMATDNGILKEGEEVVAVAGSWVGLDTAVVIRAANSVSFLKDEVAVEVREIICKPRRPTYTWPVNQKDWVGNLEPYKKFTE